MNPFLFRRIRGPIFLLCFAVTALLAQWGILGWDQSWPLYLITAGVLRLVESAVVLGSGVAVQGMFGGRPYPYRLYRSSFAGGIVLLLVGCVALLITTGVLGSYFAWQAFSVWWPLLLILVGLLLLVERIVDRGYARRAGPGVPVGRPRLGGGLVLLLILLIALGVIGHHSRFAPGFSSDDWGNWNYGWNWNGETHTNTVSFARSIPRDAVLTIQNAHGDLQIGPSADGQIHVDATQVAHVSDRRKDRAFAATRPQLTVHGGSVSLNVPGSDNVSVRLALAVPPGVLCAIHNHRGAIAVSGLTRAVEINQDHGDVALDSLGGAVHLTMNHGDIHARALSGDFTVDGRADDITASGIGGRTVLRGEFFGDTDLEQVSGPVEFSSNRTQLQAQHLTGDLSLDSGDLSITGVSGGLTVSTHSKDVAVTGLSGDAQISDSNGDLSVALAKPLGAVTLREDTGDVMVSIPDGAGFSFAGSNGGNDDFSSDFTMTQSTSGDTRLIHGQVGAGGPQIVAHVAHGDLNVRRVAADAERPEQPERPQPPKTPEPPQAMRHLQPSGTTPALTSE